MLDLRLKEHANTLSQLERHLGDSLLRTIIHTDTHLRVSQSLGVPITYSMPGSRGTRQYKDLAREVIDDLGKWDHIKTEQLQPDSSNEELARIGIVSPNGISSTSRSLQIGNLPCKNIKKALALTEKYCPYLGGLDDPQTISIFPSAENRCYRSKPEASPNLTHQKAHCISDQYNLSPMFTDYERIKLPS